MTKLTPIYDGHNAPEDISKQEYVHCGLWFDRFFHHYQRNGQHWSLAKTAVKFEPKHDWIEQVAGKRGDPKQLQQFADRQQALTHHLGGRSERFVADWHFVTGMGNPHPVENGLSWHHTLGVPYLNGAAVKGLVRAWVEINDDRLDDAQKQARLKRWFGTESKDKVPEQAGGFLFFDALPDQAVELVCDIMTPHMGKWYSDGDKADVNKPDTIPADWHEPVPVPFLVSKNTRLLFSIAPRIPEFAEELDEVFKVLTLALEWLGAGAKTATGYGYFSFDEAYAREQEEIAKQQVDNIRISNMCAEQLMIEALRKNFLQKQNSNVRESMGGPLYNELRQLVSQAADWPIDAKQELLTLANEIVDFIGAKKNANAKALLSALR
ncbi:MAG: type III-B CRISPR module RAMP protein Cmr6 [Gammaproteobacteria bacterium]